MWRGDEGPGQSQLWKRGFLVLLLEHDNEGTWILDASTCLRSSEMTQKSTAARQL